MKDVSHWQELFDECLEDLGPESLFRGRDILVSMRDEGVSVDSALRMFEDMRSKGEGILSEQEDDRIMEWMDFLYGWCSPSLKIWDEFPKGFIKEP